MPGRAPRSGEVRLSPAQSREAGSFLKQRWQLGGAEWSAAQKLELVAAINALDAFRGPGACQYSVRKLEDWLSNARYRARAKQAQRLPSSWSRESRGLARQKHRRRGEPGDDGAAAGRLPAQTAAPPPLPSWPAETTAHLRFPDAESALTEPNGLNRQLPGLDSLFALLQAGPGDGAEPARMAEIEAAFRRFRDRSGQVGWGIWGTIINPSIQCEKWSDAARRRVEQLFEELERDAFPPNTEAWMKPYLRKFSGKGMTPAPLFCLGVIKGRLRRDGHTTEQIQAFSAVLTQLRAQDAEAAQGKAAAVGAPDASETDVAVDQRFRPFLRMLKVGVPFPAVRQHMSIPECHGLLDTKFTADEMRAFEEQAVDAIVAICELRETAPDDWLGAEGVEEMLVDSVGSLPLMESAEGGGVV